MAQCTLFPIVDISRPSHGTLLSQGYLDLNGHYRVELSGYLFNKRGRDLLFDEYCRLMAEQGRVVRLFTLEEFRLLKDGVPRDHVG